MSQEELPEIAAAVARALGLERIERKPGWWLQEHEARLEADGSNVFADPWFRLCVLWLLEHGIHVSFGSKEDPVHEGYEDIERAETAESAWCFMNSCPAAEFPARAIAALVRGER